MRAFVFASYALWLAHATGCTGTDRCAASECLAPDAGDLDAARGDDIVALRVDPDTLALDLAEGEDATAELRAFVIEADGDEHPATGVTWRVSPHTLAAIDDDGRLHVTATRGGVGRARAELGALSAYADLSIRVTRTVTHDAPEAAPALFAAEPIADPATAPVLLYPLDGALTPRNLRPPVVQWRPMTGAGDVYRVRLETPHARAIAYVAAADHAWPVDEPSWRLLIESDPDAEITIAVDRYHAARDRVVAGADPVHVRVARGVVGGDVYYWALDEGRIMAVTPATAARRDVVPTPPAQPDGQRCIACHTVSRDGRWLFGRRFDDDAGFVLDLSTDLTTDPVPTRYPPASGIDTAAFDPTGDFLLASRTSGEGLFVVDARTGDEHPTEGLDAAGAGASMPAWSPRGDLIAFVGGPADTGDPDSPRALHLARRTATDPLTFDTPVTLDDGITLGAAPEGGAVSALPTFTPDDRFVVFQHGPRAYTTGLTDPHGALYLVSTDTTTTPAPVRLDRVSGAPGDAFWPTASPYVTDEGAGRRVYFIAFHSRRDYGNALAGTWGTRKRQLWIAAVDADPSGGVDPSSAPVWLPGQDPATHNVAAHWAPEPCKGTGASCVDGGECCGGVCADGPTGEGRTCAAPPE